MMTVAPEADVKLGWSRVETYLRSYATVTREAAPPEAPRSGSASANEMLPITPPVMPFHLLAELLRADAAAALRVAGAAVEQACGQVDTSPLTEQERNWLIAIEHGDRMVDIAESCGYAERTLYRALSQLWKRIGVGGRVEAIVLANKNGWLA